MEDYIKPPIEEKKLEKKMPLLVPSSPAIMRSARDACRTHAGDMLHAAMCPGDMRFRKLTTSCEAAKKK